MTNLTQDQLTQDRTEMVRIVYVGRPGALDEPRLAGLRDIPPGHQVDVPRWLAEEYVARGLFAWPEDYLTVSARANPSWWIEIKDGGRQPAGHDEIVLYGDVPPPIRGPDVDGIVHEFLAVKREARREPGGQPLEVDQLERLGPARLKALVEAGIETWEALAGLDDAECEALADEVSGISVDQLKTWRDAAMDAIGGE